MKNWTYLLIIFVFWNCKAQENDCSKVRTGKFEYVLENRPELITRTDSTQIEINPITKVEVYSSIEWKSKCEYVMTYERILNFPEDVKHMIGQKINVKIISVDPKGYKAHATSPRIDNILEFVFAE